jgi:ABC-2 type transport system ATP-binding protein
VALALVNRPELVFLDEMTTGLDPTARRVAWELIAAIRDQGATVVLVTHFMDEAARLCDRVGILVGGRLVALDTVAGLMAGDGAVEVRFTDGTDGALDLGVLERLAPVERVARHGVTIEVRGRGPLLAVVGHALVEQGVYPDDLRMRTPTLEDVYLRLTAVEGA